MAWWLTISHLRVLAEEAELALVRGGEELLIEREGPGGEALGDGAMGVVDLEQVADLVAGVLGAGVPDLAAEEEDVTSLAEHGFELAAFVGRIGLLTPVKTAARLVAAGDYVGRGEGLVEVIEVVVGGAEIDREVLAIARSTFGDGD
jgi:hypothetical protein